MTIRIAAASSDGKVVNKHFGASPQFIIIDVNDDGPKYVETRKNEPPCNQDGHNNDLMLNAVRMLSDCALVMASRVGYGAREYLRLQGIDVIESGEFIMEAVERLRQTGAFQKYEKEV